MNQSLVRDLRAVAAAAVVTAAVVSGAPSVAAKVVNADKVDGKSAVGAKATAKKRAGKLVATNRAGMLPSDIVGKVADAELLDGLDSTELMAGLVPRTAVRGELQVGVFGVFGGGSSYVGDVQTFRSVLPAPVPASRTRVLLPTSSFTPQCPGPGQVVPNRYLCVYLEHVGSVVGHRVIDPVTGQDGVAAMGFGVYSGCSGGNCVFFGSYAVRAGTAADTSLRPGAGVRPH